MSFFFFNRSRIIFLEIMSLPEVDWAGLVDQQTHLCLPSARSIGVCHWPCSMVFRGSSCCRRERLYSVIYSVAASLILSSPPCKAFSFLRTCKHEVIVEWYHLQ